MAVEAAALRLLTFSTLYPHAGAPNHGVFVENRLRHLVGSRAVHATVLAPVPYFPFRHPMFGSWAVAARAPAVETRHGLAVLHPRFPAIPRFGMWCAPWLLYRASLRALRRLQAAGERFDAIDAHYFYPDGVAATWLGRATGLPVVITARGSDLTQIANWRWPRHLIGRAIAAADALITVSAALRADLIRLGAPPDKVTVLRNGVDTDLFRPADRAAARTDWGLDGPTLLSVGHLVPRKGHDLVITALGRLPGYRLLIAGEGPERRNLSELAERLDLGARVRFLGSVPHADLPCLYTAADILVLASSREGWANVLLEAMACGTPVLASNIPGNPEVVREPAAGLIMAENTVDGIVSGVEKLLAHLPDRTATRAYAECFDWSETTAGQLALFRSVIGRR